MFVFSDTFCDICQVQSYTPDEFYAHMESKDHLLQVAKASGLEPEEEEETREGISVA